MRHQRNRLRLNHKPDHAKAVERNLVTSLLLYESIRTTKKRALVARPIIDRLITTAKTKEPHIAIRSINSVVTDRNASRKLMEVLRERYASRPSGFTTVTAVGSRKGDGAQVVDFSLVDAVIATPAAPAKPEKKKEKKEEKKDSASKAAPKKTAAAKKSPSAEQSSS